LRRKVLTSARGVEFLVDLEGATHLNDQDAFVLDDDRLIAITAAPEELVQVTGDDLLRFAWHIGNRHTPCQVETARLLISRDHVIEAMLRQLGAELTIVHEPFLPEGGAYGHGRTFGHDHGHDHGHSHDHTHAHSHD
jgi:urease accessory protein